MISFEEIVKKLQDRNITKIASATGLSYKTVENIRDGVQTNPTINTVKALSQYFEAQESDIQE